MNTDKQFHELFSIHPEWLFELTGRKSPGQARMQSVTLKAIERTAAGLFVPDDESKPLTIAEWQFYLDRNIYDRTVIAMAIIQPDYPDRDVEGVSRIESISDVCVLQDLQLEIFDIESIDDLF